MTNNLQTRLETLVAASGVEAGIAIETLDGNDAVFIHADTVYHAASTMKIAVMVELFRQAEAGNVQLTETMPVVNEFKSIVDGSPYHLDQEYDLEQTLYAGQPHTLAALCHLMITVSSNLATNLLMERLGIAHIQATLHDLDIQGLQIQRGLQDLKAFDAGINNTTTARALARLLLLIGQHRILSAAACDTMLGILKQQHFRDAIPAQLPAGIEVGNKTGEITGHYHDAAVVFAPRPFVIVILTRGLSEDRQSAPLIAEIARLAYTAINP